MWFMDGQPARLSIQITGDADPEEIADASLQLRRELLDLDIPVEVPVAGEPPAGARAVEVAALGSLSVTIVPGLLTAVVAVARSWLSVVRHRSIKLEINGDALELTGLPAAERQRLTDEWLRRHEDQSRHG
jgi:hypothetical protein